MTAYSVYLEAQAPSPRAPAPAEAGHLRAVPGRHLGRGGRKRRARTAAARPWASVELAVTSECSRRRTSLACSRSLWGGSPGTACPKACGRSLGVGQPCLLTPRASRMAKTASPGPGRLPTPTDRTAAYSVQFPLVETGGRNSSHASQTVKQVIGDLKALYRKIASRAAEHRGTFLLPS